MILRLNQVIYEALIEIEDEGDGDVVNVLSAYVDNADASRRADLTAEESIYPEKKALIQRRKHLSVEEQIYPEKKALIQRRVDISREESTYPEKSRYIQRRRNLSREESIYP